MKKTLLATAMLLAISPAHAITSGEAFEEPAFVAVSGQNYLGQGGSCSGTVLARNWVVTAAHCWTNSASVRTQGNQSAPVKRVIEHPKVFSSNFDIKLLELETPLNSVYPVNSNEPVVGTPQMLAGYSSEHGGNLQRVTVAAKGYEQLNPEYFASSGMYLLETDPGHSTPGDSGGPCYNEGGVWGTIMSAGHCNSIFHPDTKTWLLESINSWSYPAEVKGEGSVTIKVQSLHQGDEVFTPTALNGLEIESNSCETNSTVPPFGICEVVVKGSGQLSLGGDNLIEVNKPVVVPPQPEENGGNGGGDSGGGAAGWLALLGLGALVARRRRG